METMTAGHEPEAAAGAYLWQVRVPRWNSAIGMILCAVFGVGLAGIALHLGATVPALAAVVLWMSSLAACWGAYAFGRWVLRPPLAIAATEDGLISFLRVDKGDYGPPGFLVPWAEVASLSCETYVSNRRRCHALVVHLRPGHAPMPADRVSLQHREDALHWNAWSAATGKRVASDLEPFLQRFNPPRRPAGR
jgi:hypothetical protein